MTYRERQARARERVFDMLDDYAENNYSYFELADWYGRLECLARRYGLTRELRDNGIL